jgi:hypothetical protein
MKMRKLTEAEVDMLQALGQVVIVDRLKRAKVAGADEKGRTIIVMVGQPSEAEVAWERIRKELGGTAWL